MLTHMAQRISSFFISKDIVPEEERSIYDYSFEILLSTIMNFLAVVIIAFISHTVTPTIWFLIGFMAIRATAGGFHAETHVVSLSLIAGTVKNKFRKRRKNKRKGEV